MKEITGIEDQMQGYRVVEFPNGKRARIDARHAKMAGGLVAALRAGGFDLELCGLNPNERVPVFQHGRVIGTVPGDFDPLSLKPGLFYDPRETDFLRTEQGWKAADNLGPGDFDSYISGFVWERDRGDEPPKSGGRADLGTSENG